MNNQTISSDCLLQRFGLFLLLMLTLASSQAQAADITVKSSRNPVSLDDSFHLIYEADSTVDGDPEFSPIYKNFDVLSSSQSTNMRSINGNWSMKKTWDLAVIAKDIGTFTIPAISFGKDTSPAIRITVTNSTSSNSTAPNGQATVPAKLFLESSIDKKSGWIESQFIYTVKLFRTVNLVGASITEPTTSDPDAIIEPIGEDDYQSTHNGIRYNVFERRYAIYPQKSGTLKINPVTFEGRVQSTQPRSIFDQFRMSGKIKRLRSKAQTINVKAAPQSVNLQDWLPAKNIQIIEDWSGDINDIQVGEPITRTITIVADGLTAVQLPDLQFDDIQSLKQYPDKAIMENRPASTGITGLKQIKIALIPANTGSYTLPAIQLKWWNTETDSEQTAILPEVNLNVTGVIQDNNAATPAQQTELSDIDKNQTELTPEQSAVAATSGITESEQTYWKWLSIVFALAWLITLYLYFKKFGNKRDNTAADNKLRSRDSMRSIKSLAQKVKRYAKDNNALETRLALIQWAAAFYDDTSISNLSDITQLCSTQLASSIRQLDQSLYSAESPVWMNKELIKIFDKEQQLKSDLNKSHKTTLKSLYSN